MCIKKVFIVLSLLAVVSCSSTKKQDIKTEVEITPKVENNDKSNQKLRLEVTIAKSYFGFDSFELKPEAKGLLQSKVEEIKKSNLPILIEGHCDARGSSVYNMKLGEKRAQSVKDYLIENGIDKEKISIKSFGKKEPEVLGNTEEAFKLNRRAVITILN